MVNTKKNKINAALERVLSNKLSNHDLLSNDLPEQVARDVFPSRNAVS
jgi:hypothetical protein